MKRQKKQKKSDKPVSPRSALRLEYRKPSELADNPGNWRKHPTAQLEVIEDVLSEIGWAGVLLYNERTQRLIDGHARKMVASKSDEPVPVVIGNWSEEEEQKILLTLDPITGMAQSNADSLKTLLDHVAHVGDSISETIKSIHRVVHVPVPKDAGSGGDEFVPNGSEQIRANVGDVWVFDGGHRLFVGSNSSPESKRLFRGDMPSLVFTSPPYAQQREYEAGVQSQPQWDKMMLESLTTHQFAPDVQILVNLGLVHKGEVFQYWNNWIEAMRMLDWKLFAWYVWDQGSGLLGDWHGRLAPAHEFIFHLNKKPVKPNRTQECVNAGEQFGSNSLREKDGQISEFTHAGKTIPTHKIRDSIIRANRNGSGLTAHGHPAPFPIKLPTQIIESWNGIVYDPFLGSGTTLIAAHRLNRVCYGCELEPKYAECIFQRCDAEGIKYKKERN